MKKGRNLLLLAILLLGIGFAAVSTTLYINGNINISSNSEDFDVKFTKAVIDSEDKTSEVISKDGKTIYFTTKELKALNDKSKLDFEFTNNSSMYDAEVSIECVAGEKGEYYRITKEVATSIPSKTTDAGSIEVQKVKVTTEDIEEAFTCTLTAVAQERTIKGEEPVKVNQNIVNKDIECLKNKEADSCAPGTEIRYMVNDSDERTFYVLHDDGETMTLQQSEDTLSSAWYGDESNNNNTFGPTVALQALEDATSGWSNVNTLNYEMGTTVFKDNAYTGCSETSCTTNTYTLGRSGKARMITVQEAISLGCSGIDNSCPTWMTPSYDRYWTMSTDRSSSSAWNVHLSGRLTNHGTSFSHRVRAVVVISK